MLLSIALHKLVFQGQALTRDESRSMHIENRDHI